MDKGNKSVLKSLLSPFIAVFFILLKVIFFSQYLWLKLKNLKK